MEGDRERWNAKWRERAGELEGEAPFLSEHAHLLPSRGKIDLHPTVFPVGGFAQTGIHHVAGLLLRASEDRYEFFALRTFAAFTWEVLVDAARPFGYQIEFP